MNITEDDDAIFKLLYFCMHAKVEKSVINTVIIQKFPYVRLTNHVCWISIFK